MSAKGHITATELVADITAGRVSAYKTAEDALVCAVEKGMRLNAILHLCTDRALKQAMAIDKMVADGRDPGPLAGVPIAVKDNISVRDHPATCGSRMLEDYIPQYDATVVTKLEQAGAVIIAKTNMDEFAMGSSSEHSAFGAVQHPTADGYVPGGSSGGSAAIVAAGVVPLALGSDTGGSVRQPASFCGVIGLRPTYGAISRYGLIAFASSFDQIGPFATTVQDCRLLYSVICGKDVNDATSLDTACPARPTAVQNLTFGIPEEYFADGLDPEVREIIEEAIDRIRAHGCRIETISLPSTKYAVPAYYIIANAEASSNLARFDGVKYGFSTGRERGQLEMYAASRSHGFGDEVKRRIMLGTFALSAGFYDAYYGRAQTVREIIRREFKAAFEDIDFILSPVAPTPPFMQDEKIDDPMAMYLSDIYTTPAALAQVPAISIPCGKTADDLPVGLQITGPAMQDDALLSAAALIERLLSD